MDDPEKLKIVRMNLIETGGRTSQEFGFGRIVGQILVYLYLNPKACPLDELERDLGLSKASVSIAARQLEQLGLVQQVWLKGERKKYYRSAENIGKALQQGILTLVRKKVNDFGDQLDGSISLLNGIENIETQEAVFLQQRLERAGKLQKKLDKILGNPLIQVLTKTAD